MTPERLAEIRALVAAAPQSGVVHKDAQPPPTAAVLSCYGLLVDSLRDLLAHVDALEAELDRERAPRLLAMLRMRESGIPR